MISLVRLIWISLTIISVGHSQTDKDKDQTTPKNGNKPSVPVSKNDRTTTGKSPNEHSDGAKTVAVPLPARTSDNKPGPEAGHEARGIIFPIGTEILIRTIDSIDANKADPDHYYQATLAAPLVKDGNIIAQTGTSALLLIASDGNKLFVEVASLMVNAEMTTVKTKLTTHGKFPNVFDRNNKVSVYSGVRSHAETETARIHVSTGTNIHFVLTRPLVITLRPQVVANPQLSPEEKWDITLDKCESDDLTVMCVIVVTSPTDGKFTILPQTWIVPSSGDQQNAKTVTFGSHSDFGDWMIVPSGVSVKVAIGFPGFATKGDRIAVLRVLFSFDINGASRNESKVFSNISLVPTRK